MFARWSRKFLRERERERETDSLCCSLTNETYCQSLIVIFCLTRLESNLELLFTRSWRASAFGQMQIYIPGFRLIYKNNPIVGIGNYFVRKKQNEKIIRFDNWTMRRLNLKSLACSNKLRNCFKITSRVCLSIIIFQIMPKASYVRKLSYIFRSRLIYYRPLNENELKRS